MSEQNDEDLKPKQQEPNLEKQPPPEEPSREQLSKMAGFIQQEEDEVKIRETKNAESYLVNAQGNFWERIGARSLIMAAVVFAGMSFLALGGRFLTTAFNEQENPKPIAQKSPVIEESAEEETASLKTEVALGSQKAELEKFNSKTLDPTPKSSPVSNVKINTKATLKATSQPKTIATKVPNVTTTSAPVYRYEPAPSVKQPIILSSKPAVSVRPQIKTQAPLKALKVEPPLERKVVIHPSDSVTTQNKANTKTEAVKSEVQIINPEISTTGYHTGQSLIVGTRADARLQNAIVLAESSINEINNSSALKVKARKNSRFQTGTKSLQTYPIKLTQDLKTPDGSVIIPKNSFLITQVKSLSKEGWIDLSVVSIVIKSKSGTLIKPVPPEAILVQKRDGSPVQGKLETLSLSYQTGEKETISSISRTSRLPVRHGIDPVNNQSAESLDNEQPNGSNNKQPALKFRAFTLKKNTALQIYINRSFSLN
jgi:hypothetical protein